MCEEELLVSFSIHRTMATGDLSNNIRKLKAKLKLLKYTEDIDINGYVQFLFTCKQESFPFKIT